jgi:hypothetical protein
MFISVCVVYACMGANSVMDSFMCDFVIVKRFAVCEVQKTQRLAFPWLMELVQLVETDLLENRNGFRLSILSPPPPPHTHTYTYVFNKLSHSSLSLSVVIHTAANGELYTEAWMLPLL